MTRPIRFVLATPLCDGHDVAVCAITRILRGMGVEAVYIGFNKTPYQIVKAALEEDASAVAISSYNGGHLSFLRETIREAERQGASHLSFFCGGGGTILESDVAPLERMGVAKVYRPPLSLREACADMVELARKLRDRPRRRTGGNGRAPERSKARAKKSDRGGNGALLDPLALARRLSELEHNGVRRAKATAKTAKPADASTKRGARARGAAVAAPRVWGIGGRGGSGKSTIIDELVSRFLDATRDERIAVLSIDPTLADRVRMLHCYDPRVFLRSVGLGPGDSLEKKVPPLIDELRRSGFELVLVESVGLGQNELGVAPFVDASVYCMTPEYGTQLQLEKEALLARADIVVMNKCDYPQAEAKARRVRQFVGRDRPLYSTQANRHDDPGTTALFAEICRRSGLEEMAERLEAPESAPREAKVAFSRRAYLAEIVEKHEAYYREMNAEIEAARKDPKKAETYRKRFEALRAAYGYDGEAREDDDRLRREDGVLVRKLEDGEVPVARETTCGIWVPVVGMPPRDADTSEIIRYLYKQNAPGSFPFTEGAYPFRRSDEDPIRMFAGLGLPETTNARFHLLAKRGGAPRLSTAFDSLTLYGLDSDEPGALAKVGEGGVAVDSIEDMLRLYDGFDLERTSVSMTINGPAPAILALYLAAARKRGAAWEALRGTIQTDILKEVQAQNECIFPLEPSLRLIGDMIEFTIGSVPRWHPISISGYHIGEAGANPIQELAFTLANGFTYVEILRERGLSPEEFTKRFSFFFTSGSELEFNVLGRVARRIWAVAMERAYGVRGAGQRLRFHSQTSGKSLQDLEPLHNLARVTLQAEHALHNNTNSLHTNSYKEAYSTPEEDDVLLAIGCQQIPLRESGDFKYIENLHQGAWGLSYLEDEVERAVHRIFLEIDRHGGVIPAIEHEYFRSEIQEQVYAEAEARRRGERTIVGVNYLTGDSPQPRGKIVQIPLADKKKQAARTREFKKRNRDAARDALAHLKDVARSDKNLFEALIEVVEVATLGQVTHALWEVFGRFRPSM